MVVVVISTALSCCLLKSLMSPLLNQDSVIYLLLIYAIWVSSVSIFNSSHVIWPVTFELALQSVAVIAASAVFP